MGVQTVILARTSPGADIISIDQSLVSIQLAREKVVQQGRGDVRFLLADIYHLPFPEESFDHIFVCFVLEHLRDTVTALHLFRRILKKGGTITVIEGDHDSAFFHPENEMAQEAIRCLVRIQGQSGEMP